MTLSLKSKSSISKRILYLAADRALVYHWEKGRLSESFVFQADPAGLENFARYLYEVPDIPFYIIMDVVEEEYRLETIPHVIGPDRRSLIKRKKDRLFRNTPYCHADIQGREKEGRRDDILLFSAITNAEIPAPWLKLLSNVKVPVAGMYSLPSISARLFKKLKIKSENSLLVSMQSVSGLRQSFYKGGNLKVSRLAKMPRFSTIPMGPYLAGEIEKIYRYLSSLRLLQNDEALNVYIISQGELLSEIRQQVRDTEQQKFHLLEINDVAKAIGFSGELTVPYSDALFAHLLASEPQKNQYATADETRYYSMHRGRIGMLVASFLILLVSVVWSSFNLLDGLTYQQDQVDAREKANFYDARYRIAKERLPKTVVEPYDIKDAVDLVDVLIKQRGNPVKTMHVVSGAIKAFPNLHINELIWESTTDPNKIIGDASKHEDDPETVVSIPVDEANYVNYQIAIIDGYVSPFDGNYREALDKVNNIAEELRKLPHMQRVKILKLPLDVSSESNLSGSALKHKQNIKRQAEFSLKIVMGVPHENV